MALKPLLNTASKREEEQDQQHKLRPRPQPPHNTLPRRFFDPTKPLLSSSGSSDSSQYDTDTDDDDTHSDSVSTNPVQSGRTDLLRATFRVLMTWILCHYTANVVMELGRAGWGFWVLGLVGFGFLGWFMDEEVEVEGEGVEEE